MITARELVATVLDPDSHVSWDEPIDISGHPEEYRQALIAAAEKSGADEAVLTGAGTVEGHPIAFIVSEFAFLAGSIGRSAADRIVAAIRRATAERRPLIASTASGGTRMQEGTPAFVRMADIAHALAEHKAAGVPYFVHLRHPTTGGVSASWGALGDVTIAEPAALTGFLGPRVYEAMTGTPFPTGVQVSDRLAMRGVIDGIVATEDLRFIAGRILSLLYDQPGPSPRERRTAALSGSDVWTNIEATRDPGRTGLRDLLRTGSDIALALSGTGAGERDPSVIVALATLDGVPCVVVGQDRKSGAAIGPAGLRQAHRGMGLAESLGLPLVTVIDTAGAELSEAAELGALSREIGRTLAQLTSLRTPTVSVLLGQGSGGAALALLPADVVIAAERAWLSPLPPEGASAILHGTTDRAAEMARQQRVGAPELQADGIVHHIVAELPDDDAASLCNAVAAEIGAHLRELTS
jgi:acetyl-CoA carboxylase carboxyl transferase beta subunit